MKQAHVLRAAQDYASAMCIRIFCSSSPIILHQVQAHLTLNSCIKYLLKLNLYFIVLSTAVLILLKLCSIWQKWANNHCERIFVIKRSRCIVSKETCLIKTEKFYVRHFSTMFITFSALIAALLFERYWKCAIMKR